MPTANDRSTRAELVLEALRNTGFPRRKRWQAMGLLARALGVSHHTVYRWSATGGPRWLAFALVGWYVTGGRHDVALQALRDPGGLARDGWVPSVMLPGPPEEA